MKMLSSFKPTAHFFHQHIYANIFCLYVYLHQTIFLKCLKIFPLYNSKLYQEWGFSQQQKVIEFQNSRVSTEDIEKI